MKYRIILSLLLFLTTFLVSAQSGVDLSMDLPMDPQVTKGVLDNGMTYYVRENSIPQNRAFIYLVVRAGSMDEDDDQQGLAHFCEHMAFNGTKNFPKNSLVNCLQKMGMEFGAEINAYTSFDETVYKLTIPLNKKESVKEGWQIIFDWACQITDSDEEINKERGVIHEEWRSGKDASERMKQKWLPVLLKDSRYAKRLPIGKMSVVDSCPPENLRRFRNDWYRPDLEAIIAVGDFNREEIVNKIKEKFSKIPSSDNERVKKHYDIPLPKGTYISIVTDKEATTSNIQIVYKHRIKISKTLGDYREMLKQNIYNTMIGFRLNELTQSENPPFLYGFSGYENFIGSLDSYVSYAVCANGKMESGFKTVVGENERVKNHGFTITELERTKKSMLAGIENAYREKDNGNSKNYVEECKRNFLMTKEPMPGIENEYNYFKKMLPGITLKEINSLADKWITDEDKTIIITAPENDSIKIPSKDDILSWYNEVKKENLSAYHDETVNKPLIEQTIVPGKVVKEKYIKNVDATEWTLSNGATVVVKNTDFKKDEILFTAYSPGGNSVYDQNMDISADLTASVIENSGIGSFNYNSLNKLLADKKVSVSPYIGYFTEGLSGNSQVKDLETMFQLTYLYFTDIRVDSLSYLSYMSRIKGALENKKNSPEGVFGDTLGAVSVNYHPRQRPLFADMLKEANLKDIQKIAKDRFSDASDFKFFFVGNIDLKTFKPIVEKYIGGIPSSYRDEKWRDLHIKAPEGVIQKDVFAGKSSKSISYIAFHGAFKFRLKNAITVDLIDKILTDRLLKNIREKSSEVYSIYADGSVSKFPEPKYLISVVYGSGPENVEKIQGEVFDQIKNLQQAKPTEEELSKAKKNLLRKRETSIRNNSFWLSYIKNGFLYNDGCFKSVDRYQKEIEGFTTGDIRKGAGKYFNFNNFYRISLKPADAR